MSMDAMANAGNRPFRDFLRRCWPWLVLASTLVPAVWHVVDFDEDIDPEFPKVERTWFSAYPPAAYRLAEPGDTLDRIMIYLSALAVVLALGGLLGPRGVGRAADLDLETAEAKQSNRWPWRAAFALALAGLWYSATPGPTVDGWHGLGWRTMFNSAAPWTLRAALLAAALLLAGIVAYAIVKILGSHFKTAGDCPDFARSSEQNGTVPHSVAVLRQSLNGIWQGARARGTAGLWIAALALALARQIDLPGVEPVGYWPRWAMIGALLAFNLALLIESRPIWKSRATRWGMTVLGPPGWLALVVLGIAVTWYHRPLARFKVVVPDRIYLSAMPTKRGLEVAHARHHFRTIINLFPEDTPLRSPLIGDEFAFARAHGIHYVGSPSNPAPRVAKAFLDQTLELARTPSAWPILVHCHGCMDRSPAWMGIYRFVVQGRPLSEIMQEIERHRGYRPKASVTLLYNRVLPPRAPERYWADPTAALLRQQAQGVTDQPRLVDEIAAAREVPRPGPSDARSAPAR